MLLVGLFADGGIQLVGAGVFSLFIGVAVLGPVIAQPVGRALGAPLPSWRGMPGRLARENAVRNPRRTASTAAALMIGVALVGLITIFASSLKLSISGQIDQAFRGDLVVVGDAGPGSSFSPAMAERIAKVPGVAVANPLRFGAFEVERVGPVPHRVASRATSTASSTSTPGRVTSPRSSRTRSRCRRRCSTTSTGSSASRSQTKFPLQRAAPVTIGAVFGRGQREGLADYFMSLDGYDKRFSEIADNQVYIALDHGTSVKDVRPKIEAIAKQFPGAKVNDVSGLKQQFETQINQILGLVFALLFLAIFIALLGIMNTLLLSIVERTREIGLLRAVGMTRKQVRTSVRWESIIVAVFGALLGPRARDLLRLGDGDRAARPGLHAALRARRCSCCSSWSSPGSRAWSRRPTRPGARRASTSSTPSPPSRPQLAPEAQARACASGASSGWARSVRVRAPGRRRGAQGVGDAREELVVGRSWWRRRPRWCSAGLSAVDAVERPRAGGGVGAR